MRLAAGLAFAAMLALLPAFAGLLPAAHAKAPPAIEAPGVNLFEVIPWDQVEASTPCGVGSIVRGQQSIAYLEQLGEPGLPVNPAAGCAEFRFHYKAPYPTDHVHVRFQYEVNYTVGGQRQTFPGTQTIEAVGAGPRVPPATFKQQLVSYDEHWGPADRGWVQDPSDHLPIHFNGAPQEGDLVWRFNDTTTPPSPLLPSDLLNLTGTGHMEARLYSTPIPAGLVFNENPDVHYATGHVEYSFVAFPGTRVELHDNVRDGRVHKETHYLVDVDADTLSRFLVSTQVTMLTGTKFSRVVAPDGTEITRSLQFESSDWRNLRFERPTIQQLINTEDHAQVTIPPYLIQQHGPGTYVLIVEQPGLSYPLGDAKIGLLFFVFLVVPALVALVALRNLRRLLRVLDGATETTGTSRGLLITWFVALVVAHLAVVLFVLTLGWRTFTSPDPDPVAFLVLFILVFITAGQGLLAARGSDRVIRTMTAEIDHRLRVEAALQHSNKELELFASTAVHDLGAPLRGVAGFARLLDRDHRKRLDPAGRDLLDHVMGGAARMQDLVASLLDFAQAQAGNMRTEPVHLGAVAQQVMEGLAPQAQAAGATVRIGALPVVLANPSGMARVLQNLLENALKFRHAVRKPRIDVTARSRGGFWEVAVRDNGIGIDPAELGELGQPFRRAKTDRRYEGSGLGLASAQRILEAAGGRLWIESQPGKGTTVRFELPAAGPEGRDRPRPTGTSA